MDYDRQLRRCRQFHLTDENCLLHIARRVVVEIIQTNLAPGNHFGVVSETLHVLISSFIRKSGLMRMNAECGINEFVFLG